MGHLHLRTSNPDGHKKLWVDTLGARLVKSGTLEVILFPDVVIALAKGEPTGGTDDSVVNHLGFLVKDLASTKEKLIAQGVKIVRDDPKAGQIFAMFPDAVKVEFTEDKSIAVPIKHHHIHFATNEQDEMRAWYAKMFGAVPGMRGRFKAADLPGVNLSWNPAEKPTIPTKGRGLDHIGFEIKDLKAFCARLESEGVNFNVPYREVPAIKLKIAFFTDPWGTYVELTEGLSAL